MLPFFPMSDVSALLRAEGVPPEVIAKLLEEGYDTLAVLESVSKENLEELGFKKGQIGKVKLVQQRIGAERANGGWDLDFVKQKFSSYLTTLVGGFAEGQPLCRVCSDSWGSQITRDMAEKKKSVCEYTVRSSEEIIKLVAVWQSYAHPRARNFFSTTEMLEHVLTQIARGVDQADDPILADSENCIYWFGDVTKEEEAAIRMVKPGEERESITYVNRVLAFMFATDESFGKLMSLPKTPFRMCCGNQLCINLSHISSSAD